MSEITVTITEMEPRDYEEVEKIYTEDELREIFDDNTVVIQLLNQVSDLTERLEEYKKEITDVCTHARICVADHPDFITAVRFAVHKMIQWRYVAIEQLPEIESQLKKYESGYSGVSPHASRIINDLQAKLDVERELAQNAVDDAEESRKTLAVMREALERIATILPFSPADGFHCKTIAQKALQQAGGDYAVQ